MFLSSTSSHHLKHLIEDSPPKSKKSDVDFKKIDKIQKNDANFNSLDYFIQAKPINSDEEFETNKVRQIVGSNKSPQNHYRKKQTTPKKAKNMLLSYAPESDSKEDLEGSLIINNEIGNMNNPCPQKNQSYEEYESEKNSLIINNNVDNINRQNSFHPPAFLSNQYVEDDFSSETEQVFNESKNLLSPKKAENEMFTFQKESIKDRNNVKKMTIKLKLSNEAELDKNIEKIKHSSKVFENEERISRQIFTNFDDHKIEKKSMVRDFGTIYENYKRIECDNQVQQFPNQFLSKSISENQAVKKLSTKLEQNMHQTNQFLSNNFAEKRMSKKSNLKVIKHNLDSNQLLSNEFAEESVFKKSNSKCMKIMIPPVQLLSKLIDDEQFAKKSTLRTYQESKSPDQFISKTQIEGRNARKSNSRVFQDAKMSNQFLSKLIDDDKAFSRSNLKASNNNNKSPNQFLSKTVVNEKPSPKSIQKLTKTKDLKNKSFSKLDNDGLMLKPAISNVFHDAKFQTTFISRTRTDQKPSSSSISKISQTSRSPNPSVSKISSNNSFQNKSVLNGNRVSVKNADKKILKTTTGIKNREESISKDKTCKTAKIEKNQTFVNQKEEQNSYLRKSNIYENDSFKQIDQYFEKKYNNGNSVFEKRNSKECSKQNILLKSAANDQFVIFKMERLVKMKNLIV